MENMHTSSSMAADLLVSWETERISSQSDTNVVSRESILTASVLNNGQLWSRKAANVSALVWGGGSEPSVWGLCLLREVISHSTDTVLSASWQKWCSSLTHCLQSTKDSSVLENVFTTISALVQRLHSSPQLSRDFSSSSLSGLMNSLLWFTAGPPSCQTMALTVVTQCVVYFTTGCSQYRAQLKKWALTGLYNDITQLSQGSSRLLVLLCLNSSQEWTSLVANTLSALHSTLSSAYKPVLGKGLTFDLSYFNPPALPLEEPASSAALLQQVNVFSRTLCYTLLFPPRSTTGVPLQRILGVVSFGLSIQQQQVSAHSTEALLLHSMLPLIHTALWTILVTLIDSCQHHLLPYSSHIESAIVQEITTSHQNLHLILAVHRALVAWVKVRRDCELSFLSVVTRSLLSCITSSTLTDNREVRLSGLRALTTLVDCSGPIFPPSLSSLISRALFASTHSTSDEEESLASLKLLLGCVTASNGALTPPLSKAIHVFSEQCATNKSSKQVKDFCESALVQCSLLQHPNVVPILPLHHNDITAKNGTIHVDHSTNHLSTQELLMNRDSPTILERTTVDLPVSSSAQLRIPKRPPSSQLEESVSKQPRLVEENESAMGSVPVISENQQITMSSELLTPSDSQCSLVPPTDDNSVTTGANIQHSQQQASMDDHSLPTMTTIDQDQQSRSRHFPTSTNQDHQHATKVHSTHGQQTLGEFMEESSEEEGEMKYFIDAPPDSVED